MIYKSAENHKDHTYDLCIIGSGPAGMVLVNELADTDTTICMLESGLQEHSREAEKLKRVISSRISDHSRVRILGGASAVWAGLSTPFDPIDFTRRPWIPYSGWPISYEDIQPYYRDAINRYDFPEVLDVDEAFISENVQEKYFAAPERPKNFGRDFCDNFSSEGKDLLLGATADRLILKEGAVKEVEYIDDKNRRKVLRAKKFILAAGGIENVRILLTSEVSLPAVGRYFMNHPKGVVGEAKVQDDLSKYFGIQNGNAASFFGIRLSDEVQNKLQTTNSYIRLVPKYPWSRSHGVETLLWLFAKTKISTKKLLGRAVLLTYAETKDWSRTYLYKDSWISYFRAFLAVVKDLLPVSLYTAYRLAGVSPVLREVYIRCFYEMVPHPENRIVLSDEVNERGIQVPKVTYSLTQNDKEGVELLYENAARYFAENKLAKFGPFEPEVLEYDASHHMGGTRMGIDPSTSVVNQDLQVHGLTNLFIVGSSVFPTGGSANPTLTIAALSIRLADFLREKKKLAFTKENDLKKKKILIIGAGRRIREDVLPVIESLHEKYIIHLLAAQSHKVISTKNKTHKVIPLKNITAEDVASVDLVYVAVPSGASGAVWKKMSAFDCRHLVCIVDTPAPSNIPPKMFADIFVAEDSVYIPWLTELSNITKVIANQSLYRYHGLALLEFLLGGLNGGAAWGKKIFLWGNDAKAYITEPRDYIRGTLQFFNGPHEVKVSLITKEGGCVGFAVGDKEIYLEQEEAEIIGPVESTDTIVTKMLAIKRVGLRRMLLDIEEKHKGWSLSAGRRDVVRDQLLHKVGLFFSFKKRDTKG